MEIAVNKALGNNKELLLNYFRNRSEESLQDIKSVYGESQYKKCASELNKKICETKNQLISTTLQIARKQLWTNAELLNTLLMVTYTSYITMLESRNKIWPYEYMAFSRRIGELWEPFCKLCFEYPANGIELFVPPLFSEVKEKMTLEISEYIETLNISNEQKNELRNYYGKVWSLVTSGEIKLELDCHFKNSESKYNIDFKSGFGSNEKGNTNRLLLVATVYKNLNSCYKCILLVRSKEDSNNNYFQTLKKSGIWEAYCGKESYRKIYDYSGFNIEDWINTNVNWKKDLDKDFLLHIKNNNLEQYLIW